MDDNIISKEQPIYDTLNIDEIINTNKILILGIRNSGKTKLLIDELLVKGLSKNHNKDEIMIIIPYQYQINDYLKFSNYIYLYDDYLKLDINSINQKVIIYDNVLYCNETINPLTLNIMKNEKIKKVILSQYPEQNFYQGKNNYNFDTIITIKTSHLKNFNKGYLYIFENFIKNTPKIMIDRLKKEMNNETYNEYYIYCNNIFSIITNKK